jgi:peptidoglycan-associated lipoprotein
MRRREKMKTLSWLPFCLAFLLLAACSKTVMENKTAVEQQPEPVAQIQAEPQEPTPAPLAVAADPQAREMFLNEHVHFDYDSAVLKPEAQSLLHIKAQWLRDNPDVIAVLIQGHCDERGTEAYNLALGAKRADAVKRYMADLGLGNVSMDTQSFGEEKPVDMMHNEQAWAKNRRACFVIK